MSNTLAVGTSGMGLTIRGRCRLALGLTVVLGAAGCSTTPPPTGIALVEPEPEPPDPATIEQAQRILRELEAYEGPIDGRLSAETRLALARFQRRAGLEVNGTLDPPTLEALLGRAPREPEEEAPAPAPPLPELPSAEALLAPEPERPQPPPEWLAPRLEEANAHLEAEGEAAARVLSEGGPSRVGKAEAILAAARRSAFAHIVRARLEGGFAPLPAPLLDALREALVERDLLVRPTPGGWGRGEEEAVRWLERSLGLPQTGLPSLELVEALGLDPAPLFSLDRGSEEQTAIQSGP